VFTFALFTLVSSSLTTVQSKDIQYYQSCKRNATNLMFFILRTNYFFYKYLCFDHWHR